MKQKTISTFDIDLEICRAYHKASPEEQAIIREQFAQKLNDTVPTFSRY